ncbi:MAG: fumarylacetoacetate hydrolase family protein, partial [Planctomycetota bacterium]|nr:fumarylacetoacetate hydrolase family protein [Planctomycetota bacterium]
MSLDHTHDPDLISWVESARDHADFPVQNLPFGVMDFGEGPRPVVAIGEEAFDLKVATQRGLLGECGELACAAAAPNLNALANLRADVRRELRRRISALLTGSDPSLHDDSQARTEVLRPQAEGTMFAPFAIGDYTDFYCSIHHATNVGSMFRPDNPLMPNYRHLPVGYHGRASTVVLEGGEVRRPSGQTLPVEANDPIDGPSRLLDYEFELGFYVGEGNAMGSRIEMSRAPQHIFGLSIVNDWSARDIQKWEYQPLGPF